MILMTLASALGLTVNPWPRDGWYQTQYFLFGSFPGQDNYTPIAAPAVLYWLVHRVAVAWHLDLVGEFYLASLTQNLLVMLSAYFIYRTGKLIEMQQRIAGFVAIGFLLFVLSTGLPQAFWSENITLFFMAATLLVVVTLFKDAIDSKAKFWYLTLLCGFLIGMLVVTRMTPIFLIPGIALLFFRRMPFQKLILFMGVITFITTLMMAGIIISNYERFGRYEMTNSLGRHLWQGVTSFSDRALASSTEYQALKKLDPSIQGKNWWNIPIAEDVKTEEKQLIREELLKKLAKEAILNEPVHYLMLGLKKFIITIGRAPYRLGYGEPNGHWNPLNRDKFLPPLSKSKLNMPPQYAETVENSFKFIHRITGWLYPTTIFAIIISYIAMIIGWRINRILERRKISHPSNKNISISINKVSTAVFFICGIPLILIIVLGFRGILNTFIVSGLCLSLLGTFTALLYRLFTERTMKADTQSNLYHCNIVLYSFLALMFFGSLWFSWQIESNNSRNVLPYLPFWSIMLGLTATYWMTQLKRTTLTTYRLRDKTSTPNQQWYKASMGTVKRLRRGRPTTRRTDGRQTAAGHQYPGPDPHSDRRAL